jgi:hypothetical protein
MCDAIASRSISAAHAFAAIGRSIGTMLLQHGSSTTNSLKRNTLSNFPDMGHSYIIDLTQMIRPLNGL